MMAVTKKGAPLPDTSFAAYLFYLSPGASSASPSLHHVSLQLRGRLIEGVRVLSGADRELVGSLLEGHWPSPLVTTCAFRLQMMNEAELYAFNRDHF